MRIQAINNNYNQNNIAHKAHFKPNNHLETICKRAKKTETLVPVLDEFKNNLPKQELEIISCSEKGLSVLKVMNNTTLKVKDVLCVNGENTLWSLLTELCRSYNKSFFEKEVSTETDCLAFLTDTNYATNESQKHIDMDPEKKSIAEQSKRLAQKII